MGNPNVQVDLTPYTQGNATKWTLDIVDNGQGGKGGKGGYGSYPTIVVPQGQLNTIVTFTLPNGSPWKFAPDGNAIWITDGTSDPSGPLPLPATIKDVHTFPKGQDTSLRFTDTNAPKTGQTLHYTLNLVNGSQKSSTLDPILQNGGCCPGGGGFTSSVTLSTTSFAIYLGAALIIGLVLGVLIDRWRR